MLSEEPFQPSCRRPSLPHRPGPARLGPARLFLAVAGPVIWTITLSHTPLLSGSLWNTTVMLLKSERSRRGQTTTERRCVWGRGRLWLCASFFFLSLFVLFSMPCGCVFTCMNGIRTCVRACPSWQACAHLICSLSVGMMHFMLQDQPYPISTFRFCTEEIQCEMRH